MKVKALTNFSGIVTMMQGEELDIKSKDIYEDLLRAKYVEEVKKVKTKSTKKKVVGKNEN